jgi:hypothetical protein
MTCPVHYCELAECRMWAEIAQLPMRCGMPKLPMGLVTSVDIQQCQERILHEMFGAGAKR